MSEDDEAQEGIFTGDEVKRDKYGRFLPGSCHSPGRRRGSVNVYSRESVKKLQKLGVDPIEELIKLYDEALDDGNEELAFKIMNRLIDFGYSKQPSHVETTISTDIPMLNITKKGQDESTDDEGSS